MINWKPDVYESLDELPSDMPEDLKQHIANETASKNGKVPRVSILIALLLLLL